MLEFIAWSFVAACLASFGLALAQKWGWIEWAQVHAPNDFLYKLLSCHFCTTWWACVLICIIGACVAHSWVYVLAAPIATMIGIRLW